jgi:hypothetical protein
MFFSRIADEVDCNPQKVESIQSNRIKIYHISELNNFIQVQAIRSEFEMFSKTKVFHRTPFFSWSSEYIPYHFQRIMGFSNFLSVRIESNSEWTEVVDLSKVGFEDGSSSISLNTLSPIDTINKSGIVSRSVELGIMVERGKGFFQGVTTICLVPRQVIISKLTEPIEIRQHGFADITSISLLKPGEACIFHRQSRDRPRLLQLRRDMNGMNPTDTTISNW